MELDFTELNKLSGKKRPSESLSTAFYETGLNNSTPEGKSPLESLSEPHRGISSLQREKERADEVLREYQRAIKLSSKLQTEILKGTHRGENIYALFLKAVEALSLVTSNKALYEEVKKDIGTVYGAGLDQPQALSLELKDIEERLLRLRNAGGRETGITLERIKRAIAENEERAKAIETRLKKENTMQ